MIIKAGCKQIPSGSQRGKPPARDAIAVRTQFGADMVGHLREHRFGAAGGELDQRIAVEGGERGLSIYGATATAIPEPSILMLVGLTSVLFVLNRRRRR